MTNDDPKKAPGKVGKTVATVGAVMLAGSILLPIGGPTMINILQFGGVAVGVIGIVLWRIVKV